MKVRLVNSIMDYFFWTKEIRGIAPRVKMKWRDQYSTDLEGLDRVAET